MTTDEQSHYRQQLAARLKTAPREERRAILDKAQEESGYWQARDTEIKQGDEEESIEEGLGILLKKKTLFHGSPKTKIKEFLPAEETTVGNGVYFTSLAKDAIGYARVRSEGIKGINPIIYEASVENMKMLDLRTKANVRKILPGYRDILLKRLKDEGLPWYATAAIEQCVEAIDRAMSTDNVNLKAIAQSTGEMFSNYCASLGYQGLITFEGGEGHLVKDHDTYLVFDPKLAKINREHKIV